MNATFIIHIFAYNSYAISKNYTSHFAASFQITSLYSSDADEKPNVVDITASKMQHCTPLFRRRLSCLSALIGESQKLRMQNENEAHWVKL